MTEAYNRVPKCRICQNHHWLRDGCTGDFQQRQRGMVPAARSAKKRKTKKGKK